MVSKFENQKLGLKTYFWAPVLNFPLNPPKTIKHFFVKVAYVVLMLIFMVLKIASSNKI